MRDIFKDNRGYLSPIYRKNEWPNIEFVEDRISVSRKGVVRGFHGDHKTYKLCTCLYGSLRLIVFDIWHQDKIDIILSAENGESILIKPCTLNAHQCLSDECILHYKWSEYYDLDIQISAHFNDPIINPQWELPTIVSERDSNAPFYQLPIWN